MIIFEFQRKSEPIIQNMLNQCQYVASCMILKILRDQGGICKSLSMTENFNQGNENP